MCRYNPCLNPNCQFKHVENQKRGNFEDKVWTSGEGTDASNATASKSDRFADFSRQSEGQAEELIIPGRDNTAQQQEHLTGHFDVRRTAKGFGHEFQHKDFRCAFVSDDGDFGTRKARKELELDVYLCVLSILRPREDQVGSLNLMTRARFQLAISVPSCYPRGHSSDVKRGTGQDSARGQRRAAP
ncbi:hypothetical protein MRB53_041327 [Persea americana]|nr:hypothetical protein MRB53_041327 [Persea americana]